jgi:four helix bundle protein
MSEFKSHKDLDAWKVAMDLVMAVYRFSAKFPTEERYCLVSQMRRAANSVPSNIAEGQARGLARACVNFLRIALGSLAELDTQREIALRLNYLSAESNHELDTLVVSTRKLVSGLLRSKVIRLGIEVTAPS